MIQEGDWYDEPNYSQIDVFDASYVNYINSYQFQDFLVPKGNEGGELFSAEGYYVFTNNEGTKIYSIVKADEESGLVNDWAINTINIE